MMTMDRREIIDGVTELLYNFLEHATGEDAISEEINIIPEVAELILKSVNAI